MRKSEFLISTMLAIIVVLAILGLQRHWQPSTLKEVASSAERYVLGKKKPAAGYPDLPGFARIRAYYLDREYRAALYRSDSVTLGFAPGRLVIYDPDDRPAFQVDTLEGAREAWTALYDFAGRRGLSVPGGRPRPAYLRDLTGDGKPDLVIGLYSGGNRCCTTLNVLEVERDSLQPVGHIEGLGGWPFEGLDIRRIGKEAGRQLVVHRPQTTPCGSRDDAADVISVYAYNNGQYVDQSLHFSDYLQEILQDNLAKWSREKNPSLGLLQTIAAQYAMLGQPDRAKKFIGENLAHFFHEMQQQGFDPATCKEGLNSLVDRLFNQPPS